MAKDAEINGNQAKIITQGTEEKWSKDESGAVKFFVKAPFRQVKAL